MTRRDGLRKEGRKEGVGVCAMICGIENENEEGE